MPPTPDEQKQILDDLHTLAMQDVSNLWQDASMADLSSPEFRSVMTSGVPELLDPYAASAGDLAATWYEDAAPRLAYKATPAALPPAQQLAASTSWALQAAGEAALVNIAGFGSRTIYDQARNTIVENADVEPGATWARYASADACAFCRMLASRAEVYASKAAATTVVGRRGKPRGNRGLGTRYHDHCRCRAISVRPGQTYLPPDYAKDWDKQYTAAVRATTDGGPINLKAVLAKMDELESGKTTSSTASNAAAAARAKKAAEAKAAADTKAWLAAEKQYGADVTAWLGAESQYSADVAAWLAAEGKYSDDVKAWLAAEKTAKANAYVAQLAAQQKAAAAAKAAAVTKAEKAAAAAAKQTNSAKAVAAAKTKTPGPGTPKKAKPAGPVMTPDGRPITEIDIAKEPLVVANPKAKVGTEANPRIFRAEGNFHRTYDEGIAYFSPRWKNTPGEYDPLVAANIKRYTRAGYHDMNGYLRAYDGVVPAKPILGTTEDSIRLLDKAMSEEPKIADWTVLTRGTGPAGFNLADDEDLFSTIGKTFTEQGYWSTSVGDNPAFEGEVRMIIKTPPGTKGLYLAGKPGQTSDFVGQYGSDEGEFLLGRGSDYVVESVTKRSAGASDDWKYDMVVRITGQRW